MTCSTCTFSDVAMIDTGEPGAEELTELRPHLVCRRYPPVMVGLGDAAAPAWPVVHDEEWCGEYHAKPEPDF